MTIASLYKEKQVSFDKLHESYKPMLKLVEVLIGVIPNCDRTLEIWPIGFRTYNLIVPNLMNLPQSLFGSKSLNSMVGLAMYTSSHAAECPYCTAHTCSLAMRRGLEAEKITGNRSPKEASVVALAEALSVIPHKLTKAHCTEFSNHFSPKESYWIVMSIGMMGFLNKFMDVMGIELEDEVISDTGKILAETGWKPGQHADESYKTPKEFKKPLTDNFLTYLRVFRQAPAAIKLENKWIKGVPKKFPAVGTFLKEHTGYSFPKIERFKEPRVIRTITTVLRDNLNPKTSKIGLDTKSIAGLVFSTIAGNESLVQEAIALANHHAPNISADALKTIQDMVAIDIIYDSENCKQFMTDLTSKTGLSTKQAAAITLAKAASYSPAQVNTTIVQEVVSLLEAEEVIELMVWISIQQMLHRLYTYYDISME